MQNVVNFRLITFAGPNIENSFTMLFFITYFISYGNWLLGTILPVTDDKALRGVTGYSCKLLALRVITNYLNL